MIDAGGLKAGPSAVRLLDALFEATRSSTFDIFEVIPPSYWAVTPDLNSTDPLELRLILRGAVLLRIADRRTRGEAQSASHGSAVVDRTRCGIAGTADATAACPAANSCAMKA